MTLKLKYDDLPSIIAMTDNKKLHALISSGKLSQDKRLWIDIATIKEMIKTNVNHNVRWIQNTGELVNCLTKWDADKKSLVELLKKFNIL